MTARTSCILRLAQDPFLVIRHSYVKLLDDDHCAAALLSVLEYWANGDLASVGEIRLRQTTVRDFAEALTGLYKDRSIRDALARLARARFVRVSGKVRDPKGRFYAIDPTVVNEALGSVTSAETPKSSGKKDEVLRRKRRSSRPTTLYRPRASEEVKKKEGEEARMRASAPLSHRSAPKKAPARDASSDGPIAAAEIVAAAQRLKLPESPFERSRWLDGAAELAKHPPETLRAAVELKLANESRRWKSQSLLPRYVAQDLPALLRELTGTTKTVDERPGHLYDLPAVMAICRHAGLEPQARAASKAQDWTTLSALYTRAKGFGRLEAAA